MPLDFAQSLFLYLLFAFFITLFFKKKFKVDSFFVISIWKTKKFNSFFNLFSKNKFLLTLSKIGLLFGFGMLAFDYLFLQKYSRKIRVLFLLFSSLILSFIFTPYISNFITMFSEHSFLLTFFLFLSGFSGFTLFSLFLNAVNIIFSYLSGSSACPGIAPIIPGYKVPKIDFFVPLHAWISLILILFIHESFHGFTARYFKIPIKTSGLILLGILPIGAFVEPEEKKLKTSRNKIHVYSAGPASNFISSILAFAFLFLLSSSVFFFFGDSFTQIEEQSSLGLFVQRVDANISVCGKTYPSPAYNLLKKGDKIISLNNKKVKTLKDFIKYNTKKTMNLQIERNGELLSFTIEKNSLNRIGIFLEERKNPNYIYPKNYLFYKSLLSIIFNFLYWFMLLNFLVAIANYLPLLPFDGGYILPILLSTLFGKRNYSKIMLYILLPLILINILPLFL